MENYGKALRDIRKKSGLSQQELADRMGISRQAVAQYENRPALPRRETIERIAEALKMDPFSLFGAIIGQDNKNQMQQYHFDLPAGYSVKKEAREDEYSILYPDGFVLKIREPELLSIIHNSVDYAGFLLDQYRGRRGH